jgi:hypothetical protein
LYERHCCIDATNEIHTEIGSSLLIPVKCRCYVCLGAGADAQVHRLFASKNPILYFRPWRPFHWIARVVRYTLIEFALVPLGHLQRLGFLSDLVPKLFDQEKLLGR